MAMPITPTPRLNNKETAIFIKKIEKELKKPLSLVPTPKLEEARALIKNNAFPK